MFCSNCGNQILDGDRFCATCGSPVKSAAATPGQPEAPQTTPATPVAEPAPFHFPTSAPAATPEDFSFPTAAPAEAPPAFRFPTTAPVEAPPVMPQAPVAPAEAAPVQLEKKQKKQKKKRSAKVFLPIILVVLVLAAAAAAFLLLGKKTVYVLTKDVTEQVGYTSTYRYHYDGDGRVEKILFEQEYSTFDYAYGWEISYEYDNDGNLESATLESDGETITVKYVYDDDVLSGIKSADLVEAYGVNKLKASCDDEGRFKRIAFLDSSGNEIRSYEFKYHDNGVIKKSTYSYNLASYYDYSYKYVSEYNDDGKLIEHVAYYGNSLSSSSTGNQSSRTVYDYDKKGNMCLMEQYDGQDELTYRLKMDSTYRFNKLTAFSITIEGPSGDEMQKAQIIFDCEWSGRKCTMTVDKVKGDEDLLDSDDMVIEDMEITFEIDSHGNVLEYEVSYDDEVVMSRKCEYEAIKVKRGGKKPNPTTDPLYLYFLTNN